MSLALLLVLAPVPAVVVPDQAPASQLPASTSPVPPPPATGPKPATPLTNPASWVTTQDYPPAALRTSAQGVTDFLLTVNPEGRVSECRITATSGSPVLDAATCELIRLRARFAPARDVRGTAMTGTYSNRVRWTIPQPPVPPAGELVLSVLVAPDGSSSDCRVEAATGGAAAMIGQGNPCLALAARKYAQGYRDAAGQPVSRRVRLTTRIEVLPEK